DSDINTGFTGIKVGDLNNSVNLNSTGALENRNEDQFKLMADNISFNQGEYIEIPVYLEENAEVIGTQFTVKFDEKNLTFDKILEGKINIGKNNYSTGKSDRGYVTFSWNNTEFQYISKDEPIFILAFKANNKGELKDNLSITSEITKAEIYSKENSDIKESRLQLNFRDTANKTPFTVYQNVPNPFSDYTTIGFEIPNDMLVNLTIYDITGKKMYEIAKNMSKGKHDLKVSKKDLKTTGVFYYKLQAGPYSDMKKMILIK
ncbi:MAG TPA: T9SS type A sorting domain-containing protein, partial [Bacteroidetes bacterium]|nr:T9SS type A sorting domain-containing protein [Bacteroidota bacterium]